MATVNFSVPADVRQLFNETFANRNKSAVIADSRRVGVFGSDSVHSRLIGLGRKLRYSYRCSEAPA